MGKRNDVPVLERVTMGSGMRIRERVTAQNVKYRFVKAADKTREWHNAHPDAVEIEVSRCGGCDGYIGWLKVGKRDDGKDRWALIDVARESHDKYGVKYWFDASKSHPRGCGG